MNPPTPDNAAYLFLGLAVALGSVSLYVLSLFLRVRNLRKERDTLDQLERE